MDRVAGSGPTQVASGETPTLPATASHTIRVALLSGTAIAAVAVGLLLWARSGFADP